MQNVVIKVENLKKYYQVHQKEPGFKGAINSFFKRKHIEVKAVDNVSFEINEGELVGFIGPNGAGKTTTLKVLSGLLYPTKGAVSVLGFDPFKRQAEFQKQFSLVMGQKNQLWWDLPAWESFILNKEIYEIPQEQFLKTVKDLSEMLEIQDILKVQVRKLSLGQRMKCELVAALLHHPKVLLLDEPTIGLDVVAQKTMRDFIKEYNQTYNATIILTSHYMEDVKQLCKRVVVIDKGVILFDGLLESIVEKIAPYKLISLIFEKQPDIDQIKRIGEIESQENLEITLRVKRKEVAQKTALLLDRFSVTDLTIEDPSIEDIIRKVFNEAHPA